MSRLLFVKLARDLRVSAGRISLMVIALSLSLVVFGSVFEVRAIVGEEIPRSYLGTVPASATLQLDGGVAPDRLAAVHAALRERPGVIDATLRAQRTTQVRGRDGRWSEDGLQLFAAAADDPMRVARFQLDRGTWPPPANGLLLERKALPFLGLRVGDTVVVRSAAGQPVPLTVTGAVHDPSLAPAAQEQKGYGYMTPATLALLGWPPLLDQIKVLIADRPGSATPSGDRGTITVAARSLAAWLQASLGLRVDEIQVPPPGMHPHQQQMDDILFAVLAFGGMSMLLSGVLVATMVNGLLARQVPQIGMLKAIGVPSRQVLQLYLLMTVLVAAAATALAAVPIVIVGPAYAALVLGQMLNMDASSATAPWWVFATVAAAGLVLPPLLSLGPLVRASRTTVRRALDAQGGDGIRLAVGRLDRWLGGVSGLDRTLALALRNAFRRRARLALAVGLLAASGMVFAGGVDTAGSVQAAADQGTVERAWDVEVQLDGPAPAGALTDAVRGLPHVRHVETWSSTPAAVHRPGLLDVTSTYPDQGHGSLQVYALPADTSELRLPALLEGRWLRPGEVDGIVVSQAARELFAPDLHAGDTVQLSLAGRASAWRVVGITREYLLGPPAVVTSEGFAAATGRPGEANLVEIATDRHDAATRAAVADAAERALAGGPAPVRSSLPVSHYTAIADGHVYVLLGIVLAIAGVIGVVGLIGLGSTMSANVLERTRELGVLHAIGASAGAVRRIVLAEGVLVAAMGCAAAALPALAMSWALDAALGAMWFGVALPFRVSGPAAAVWALAVMAGAALATLAPAWRASRLTVRKALAHL